jgi:hypothetical protein
VAIPDKEFDITRTVKIIEKLKSQLLSDVAQLFSSMVETGGQKTVDRGDIFANIIIITYLLAKRLGVPHHTLDLKVRNKLKLGIMEDSNTDEWFSELTTLLRHLDSGQDKNRR